MNLLMFSSLVWLGVESVWALKFIIFSAKLLVTYPLFHLLLETVVLVINSVTGIEFGFDHVYN